MDFLLNLIPGGQLTAIAAAILAAFAGLFGIYRSGKKAGEDRIKAKEADAYEQHLKDIERAANARADADRRNADPGRLRDDDGWKRK